MRNSCWNRTKLSLLTSPYEVRLILRAISFALFHLTSQKRVAKFYEKWSALLDENRAIELVRFIYFFFFSVLNGNGESYDFDLWAALHFRALEISVLWPRGLFFATGNWHCEVQSPSLSCHRITIPQRKKKNINHVGREDFLNELWYRCGIESAGRLSEFNRTYHW